MRIRFQNLLLAGNPYSGFMLEEAGFRAAGQSEPADAPAFELVRTGKAALEALGTGRYEMLLVDYVLPDMSGAELSRKVKEAFPGLPAVVVTGNTDLGGPTEGREHASENLFVYYGAPSFWRAMVKLQEDERNAPLLQHSGALIILLVEDEPNFYSHFLPALYERIRAAALELLPEERRPTSIWGMSDNRPLVLLRRSFEEACESLFRYDRNMMALITDLCFPISGERRGDAGLRLLYRARALHGHLPVVVASRELQAREAVLAADAKFLWKDSPRLLSELDNFLTAFCGFGPFVFRWPAGERYGLARTLQDLRDLIADVPDVVFEHHALHNDFSTWLAVHGYQNLANRVRAMLITEPDIRGTLLRTLDDELQLPR
ncbi:MAG: response regulator [Deltaproteobacteria bacterium]|nr:response regulator [Deltaproteobacteria bacterium]